MPATTKPPSASSPAPPGKWVWKSPTSLAVTQLAGLGGRAVSVLVALHSTCKPHVGRDRLASLSSTKIFPLLQRDRHVDVFPEKIVKGAEIEFIALLHARVGEEFQDL